MAGSSAHQALKAATADCHRRVDEIYSRAPLGARSSYGDFLQAQASACLPLEAALERANVGYVVADWNERRRTAALVSDLSELAIEIPAPACVPSFEREAELLGVLYVLEGSRLGGAILRRSVAAGLPTRFLSAPSGASWKRLLMLLDQRLESPGQLQSAVGAAREAFACFEAGGRLHIRAQDEESALPSTSDRTELAGV